MQGVARKIILVASFVFTLQGIAMTTEAENRLANETSPYLKSAAHQPVHWYPWREEAFQKAQELDRPVILDIGAVWCHWCHVIDRESYENSEIAELINENFIAVKVDRDERPDIDARYQMAVSAVSGQGGWPLTAFLTPDGNLFYGGTYFPPEDGHGRPGFKTLLRRISEIYREKRASIHEESKRLHQALKENMEKQEAGRAIPEHLVESVIAAMKNHFDKERGGFGNAPKFPHTGAIELAINQAAFTGDEELAEIIRQTLTRMGKGGVYDQLGGGFHRYSTDADWIVPHFEKMLYDNSELLKNYVHAFQLTGNPFFKEIALGIMEFVNRDLSDQKSGGFFTSQDADINLDDDGDYFTWSEEEAGFVLTAEEAKIAGVYYDIGAEGEMQHNPAKNVLFVAREIPELAGETDLTEEALAQKLGGIKSKMLEARKKRPTPAIDRTIYASWNGMMIQAYLEAYKGLNDSQARADLGKPRAAAQTDQPWRAARDFALKTIDFLLKNAFDEKNGFYHAWAGSPRIPGFLDDQIQMALALISAYEISGDFKYLEIAQKVADFSIQKFWDTGSGGFFDIGEPENAVGKLAIRQKSIQDSPNPSGNAVAVFVLEKLYFLTGEKEYLEKAEAALRALAPQAEHLGFYAATYALALDFHLKGPLKIVIAGGNKKAAEKLRETALTTFHPYKIIKVVDSAHADSTLDPAIRAVATSTKEPDEAPAKAYVCQGRTCQRPVSEEKKLLGLIRAEIRYPR